MLYSSFPLAICVAHGSLYISKLLSQFILPSPSPPGQQVHFLHLCLCSLPASRFTSAIFLGPMYMHSYATLLLLFLTSLWVTGSRFVRLSSVDSNFPFLWLSNIRCMVVCVCHGCFIHPCADGHRGCFRVLAVADGVQGISGSKRLCCTSVGLTLMVL